HVVLSLFGWDKLFNTISKNEQAHTVIVLNGAECEQGTYLRGQLALCLLRCTKVSTAAQVHHQHYGQLTFFTQALDRRRAGSRSNVPVDGSNVVARVVFAHVFELHTTTFERTVIASSHHVVHQPVRIDFNLANFRQDLVRNHRISTLFKGLCEHTHTA